MEHLTSIVGKNDSGTLHSFASRHNSETTDGNSQAKEKADGRQWSVRETMKKWWPPKLRPEDSLPELIVPQNAKNFPQVFATVAFSWMCLNAGVGLSFTAPALPSFLSDTALIISQEEISWIASVDALGCILGGVLSGPLISIGRKKAYAVLLFPIMTHWLLMIFAINTCMIYSSRFISGISLAAALNAVNVYVSEISSQHIRGFLGCMPALFVSSGFLLCFIVGKYATWRYLALFGALSVLPCFVFVFFLPESPAYLISSGRAEEAKKSLQKLRGSEVDVSLEMMQLSSHDKANTEGKWTISLFFTKGILRPLGLLLFICFLFRFCGIRSMQSYTSQILCKIVKSIEPSTGIIFVGMVQTLGNIFAVALLNRVGRRAMMLTSLFLMHVTLVILGFLVKMSKLRDVHVGPHIEWLSLAMFITYILAFAVGMSPLSGLLIGELLPIEHKGITASICGAFSWLCAFIVTLIFPFMTQNEPFCFHGTLWFYGAVCGLGFFIIYIFLPETNRKTLEQIQRKFLR